MYEGYFDGASKGNPGKSAIGYHINTKNRETIISRGQFVGLHRTCNQAELIAMSLLLADAYCNGIQKLKIYGDSRLAIHFINGTYTCHKEYLACLLAVSLELKKKFSHF